MTSATVDQIVLEMAALGAVFEILDDERWIWRPYPESHRDVIRRYLRGVALRPGGRIMVNAIRKLQVEA